MSTPTPVNSRYNRPFTTTPSRVNDPDTAYGQLELARYPRSSRGVVSKSVSKIDRAHCSEDGRPSRALAALTGTSLPLWPAPGSQLHDAGLAVPVVRSSGPAGPR